MGSGLSPPPYGASERVSMLLELGEVSAYLVWYVLDRFPHGKHITCSLCEIHIILDRYYPGP